MLDNVTLNVQVLSIGMESPAPLLIDLQQHVSQENSTEKFPGKQTKRHFLRDLELGLQQPVWMLNPQGKERPSAREQKKLAAPHGRSCALIDRHSPVAPGQRKAEQLC